jgi:hypothetical protein
LPHPATSVCYQTLPTNLGARHAAHAHTPGALGWSEIRASGTPEQRSGMPGLRSRADALARVLSDNASFWCVSRSTS